MVVITLTNVQKSLRGDLTLWLQEIAEGVYVGNVNAKVRENLWERVKENTKNGFATMSYNTDNEQKYTFRTHNTRQSIIDLDGVELVFWPNEKNDDVKIKEGFSKASKNQNQKKFISANTEKFEEKSYVVVDIETTGLKVEKDKIIQIGAIKVKSGEITEEFSEYINIEENLKKDIVELTGITDEILKEKGICEREAIEKFLKFIGKEKLIFHNAKFDLGFLLTACQNNELGMIKNKYEDTLKISKKLLKNISRYNLSDLCKYFGIEENDSHNALGDCKMTYQLYEELIKM